MKKGVLVLMAIVSLALESKAQLGQNATVFSKYSVGLSAGGTMLKGDLGNGKLSPALKINFDYNFSPFISVGAEGQYGKITEGIKIKTESWNNQLYDRNNYGGININGRLAVGQFLRSNDGSAINVIKKIYVGTGFGMLQSKASEVMRGPNNLQGKESSIVFYVPTNVGIDVPLKKTLSGMPIIQLNLNYQYNMALCDNLDAFNYRSVSGKTSRDAYSLLSIGVKFNIGGECFRNL